MGIFNKLKNIFYDEELIEDTDEEEELELKKVDREVKREKVSEDGPKVEEIKIIKQEPKLDEPKIVDSFDEEPAKERELFRSERVFNFTELDDDEEEMNIPPKRNVLNTESRVTRSSDRVTNVDITPPEQPKVFKPSPIISPIYGILDKDYKKEEVVSKKETAVKEIDSPAKNYDSVRRKAYGTLEDDLEDTLNSINKITPEQIKSEEVKDELEEKSNQLDEILNKMEKTSSVSVGDLEDKLKLEHFDDDDDEDEYAKREERQDLEQTLTDSTLEHDLFNLIDSMYDDKEE